MLIKRTLIVLSFCFLWTSVAFSKNPALDHENNILYRQACEEVSAYSVKDRYQVDCFHNYHHYNAKSHTTRYNAASARRAGKVKMGSFNLWHPGTSKSGYKDYDLVAKIMNQWDIVSAQELLAVVGEDLRHNQSLVDFINNGDQLIEDLENKIANTSNADQRAQLRRELRALKADLKKAPDIYRSPGYLKVLDALRKLDPSWALVLSARGEAAEAFHVHELVGYYYRSSKVKPVENQHCREFPEQERNGVPYACIPNFYESFMGRDTTPAFSRRPFMASFQSADFRFTLLSTHVIFTSPRDPDKIKEIMRLAFNRPDYENLGYGFNLATYARFAEIKLTLEFMQNFVDRYKNPNIIFAGDMNIESSNSFWPDVLKEFDGGRVFVDEPTSLTQIRYRAGGVVSEGVTSNYDHFLFSPKLTPQCVNKAGQSDAKAFNFYQTWVSDFISKNYLVRFEPEADNYVEILKSEFEEDPIFDEDEPIYGSNPIADNFISENYDLKPGAEQIIGPKMRAHEEELRSRMTIRQNKIVWDDSRFEQRLATYKSRIFLDQLSDRTYYRIYYELISDHFPIAMSCSNQF